MAVPKLDDWPRVSANSAAKLLATNLSSTIHSRAAATLF